MTYPDGKTVSYAYDNVNRLSGVTDWTGNKWGECNVPENLHDIVAISAGSGQSLALKCDGTVVAWGMTVIPDWYG
jgi:YD repeat-containing protein